MTTHLTDHARPTAPLLSATRWLAAAHVLGGLAGLGYAVWSVVAYNESDDTFAGLLLFAGGIVGIAGLFLIVLCAGALMARSATGTFICALNAGLFVVLALVGGGWFFVPSFWLFLLLAPLALVTCSVVGLVRSDGVRHLDSRG